MFAVFVALYLVFGAAESVTKHPLVMVLSFDGFRPDYVSEELTPNLFRFQKSSVAPPYMRSVFPTKTFVNHFSMATGLYAEEHGVLDNHMFDENFEKMNYSSKMFHYDESVVPIWIQNENTGNERFSGVMMWPGSNHLYQNKYPTYYKIYNKKESWHSRIDTMMSWITDKDRPANLVFGYFEEPDYSAHINGVETPAVRAEIARVDIIFKYLLECIKTEKLENKLNLIILSDHGMTTVTYNKMVFLDEYVPNTIYKIVYSGPSAFIHPDPGKMDEVYNSLKKGSIESQKFNVYKPEELPDRWKIKKSPRLNGLLYVLAEPSHSIWDERLRVLMDSKNPEAFQIGTHGYDNNTPDMHAIFMASGPIFKKNAQVQPFDNINLYVLISYVMNLDKPSSKLQPHGSLSTMQNLLHPNFSSTCGSIIQLPLVKGDPASKIKLQELLAIKEQLPQLGFTSTTSPVVQQPIV